jgi:hypothetical protein
MTIDQRLMLFQELFETLRNEGNGIWERFNIMVGVNLALFGGTCLPRSGVI